MVQQGQFKQKLKSETNIELSSVKNREIYGFFKYIAPGMIFTLPYPCRLEICRMRGRGYQAQRVNQFENIII